MLTFEDIKEELIQEIANDRRATQLMELIDSGAGTYRTASEYSIRVGESLGRVLRRYSEYEDISEWDLESILPSSLGLNHSYIVEACRKVQDTFYNDAGLDIKFVEPAFNGDRAYGLVEEVSSHADFSDIEKTFYDQLVNFSQTVVVEAVQTNAEVLNGAGVESKIVRHHEFRACEWCEAMAGSYNYVDVRDKGNDVWRRHENCRCTIDYYTFRNGGAYRERVNNQVK